MTLFSYKAFKLGEKAARTGEKPNSMVWRHYQSYRDGYFSVFYSSFEGCCGECGGMAGCYDDCATLPLN